MSDDTMATSRAIDAIKDTQMQDFAEKLVDRVSAILGNHQLRLIEAMDALEANQAAFSHPLGALVAKQDLITEHLIRQDKSMEALSIGQSALRDEFLATGEHLDQWRKDIEQTLEDSRQAHQRSIEEHQRSAEDRRALHADLEESKADRTAIRAEQQARDRAMADRIEERDAAYQAKLEELYGALTSLKTQYDTLQIQYGELEESINGRLTQLIERSEAVARREGRDEERKHPGGG